MKFIRLFTVLLIWSTGCSLFRQTSRTTGEIHTLSAHDTDWEHLARQEQNTDTKVIRLRKDTSNTAYSIQLWPKGSFTFSADKGFTGEAVKIEIKGNANTAVMTASAVDASQVQKEEQVVTYRERDKKETGQEQETKSSSVSWKWIVAGLILIAAGGIWLSRLVRKIWVIKS